ncbi:877_t:CDS:2, partial [Racocetra fulgida]
DVYLYAAVEDGKYKSEKEIFCYDGKPGIGKTTFIKTLNRAMGRGELQIISCAGLKEFKDYSILGDENKPNLIELFKMYKSEGKGKSKKLFDKYYQMDIELDYITFFATVNYSDQLVPALKKEVEMRKLEDYSDEDKEKILELKKKEIEGEIKKIYPDEKNEIIPEEIIKILPKYINEKGIRQTERNKNGFKWITCENLGEVVEEFKKFRNSQSKRGKYEDYFFLSALRHKVIEVEGGVIPDEKISSVEVYQKDGTREEEMNRLKEQLREENGINYCHGWLSLEKKVKQKAQQEGISKNFSWVLFFAGEEYNQELAQQEIPEKNIIDFAQVGQEKEHALLPIFDHQQNTNLFGEAIDLSNYILIATSSTRDMGQLSLPLVSRLECVNVDTVQPKKFFLDKYFENFLSYLRQLLTQTGHNLKEINEIYFTSTPSGQTGLRVSLTFLATFQVLNPQVKVYHIDTLLLQAGTENCLSMLTIDSRGNKYHIAVYQNKKCLLANQVIQRVELTKIREKFSDFKIFQDFQEVDFLTNFQKLKSNFLRLKKIEEIDY